MKTINPSIQEAQKNAKQKKYGEKPRNIIITLLKTSHKRENLKSAQRNKQILQRSKDTSDSQLLVGDTAKMRQQSSPFRLNEERHLPTQSSESEKLFHRQKGGVNRREEFTGEEGDSVRKGVWVGGSSVNSGNRQERGSTSSVNGGTGVDMRRERQISNRAKRSLTFKPQ